MDTHTTFSKKSTFASILGVVELQMIIVLLCMFISLSVDAQIYINEVMSSNSSVIADNAGEYDDWIELYNSGSQPLDLNGYYISDNLSNPEKHQFTSSISIPANGYLIIWADDDLAQGANHTNFKLSQSGEAVILSEPNGEIIVDSLSLPEIATDHSYGHIPDASGNFSEFAQPTPNLSNNNSVLQLDDPELSIEGGIYATAQTLSITASSPNCTIRYTTDGSEPDANSLEYTSPLTIDEVTTIRVKVFKQGFLPSEIISASYFIGVDHDLPIVNITMLPDHLWDPDIGIHVIGNDTTTDCRWVGHPANFCLDLEYPANIQLYETDGTLGFNIDAGISLAGGSSRNLPMKSFRISTRSIYSSDIIEYQLFPESDQQEFRRFTLRNSGNDFEWSGIADAFNQSLVEGELDLEIQRSRHTVVYVNGAYWGLMKIRDAYSEHYLNYKFPKLDRDSIDLIQLRLRSILSVEERAVASEGTTDAFWTMYDFIKFNDLSIPTNYEEVDNMLDVNQYINYNIIQIYLANIDWPANNVRIWRDQRGGKFRHMLFDTDTSNGQGIYWGSNPRTMNPPEFNSLHHATTIDSVYWPNDSLSTIILHKLLDNESFKNEFVQRFATQMNVLFTPERMDQKIEEQIMLIAHENPRHLSRWWPNGNFTVDDRSELIQRIIDWYHERPSHMKQHILDQFNIADTFQLSLNFDQTSNGVVLMNSNQYAVPYQYSGQYYANIPVEIHAIPAAGFRFSHWQETGDTNSNLYQSFNSDMTLTPVFVPASDLVINEIHYNPRGSSESAEFIEIYNPDTNARSLNAYEFGDGVCFEFPADATIGPGEYIVIANDASIYQGNGYQVFEWEDSNLNNNGEHLSLINRSGQVIDSLSYNDGGDWIGTADGGFYSLALIDASTDNSLASSWDVQSQYITPGQPNEFLPFDTYHLPADIVINEIHYHPFDSITPSGDTLTSKNYEFIELKNLSNTAISLDGVALTRGITYEFPAGSVLPANGFVLLAEDSLLFEERYGFYPMGVYSGKLSNSGELIWLSDEMGKLLDAVRYDDVFPWDAQADGGSQDFSLALIDATLPNDTYINWQHQCSTLHTPNQENDFGCFQGQTSTGLTINELHYAPAAGNDSEYIELHNASFTILQLEGMTFSNGVTFTFDNTLMLPGSYVVVARDSATFHNTYGFAPDGEYLGTLNNGGERVRLVDFFGNEIDDVLYSSTSPWETLASQGAHSLALIDHTLDNALAESWCIQDNNVTPRQANSFGDSDGDGFIDCEDSCPALDNTLIGTACNDGDPCTTGETYDANCGCSGGVFQDSDNDGVCDVEDQCAGLDDALIGMPCDDGNPCTINEIFTSNCQCSGGENAALDGTATMSSQFSSFPASNLNNDVINDNNSELAHTGGDSPNEWMQIDIGSTMFISSVVLHNRTNCCSDRINNAYVLIADAPFPSNTDLTQSLNNADVVHQLGNEANSSVISVDINQMGRYIRVQKSGTNTGGNWINLKEIQVFIPFTVLDTDNDGICDVDDQCPGFDNTLIGQPCDDGDPCTDGETYDSNCGCSGGSIIDSDNDGICDANDSCPNFDDNLIGQPCDDGIICFVGSTWDSNCNCTGGAFADTDGDNVCDPLDLCPGLDDSVDVNGNGIPDGCEGCVDYVTETNNPIISQNRSANIEITTNGRVFIGDIEYQAGQEINLMNGFEVKAGAVFHAYIAPCSQ